MTSEAAPVATAGGEDWKAQLQLPPKDSRIRTAVSVFFLVLAREERCLFSLFSSGVVARALSTERGTA